MTNGLYGLLGTGILPHFHHAYLSRFVCCSAFLLLFPFMSVGFFPHSFDFFPFFQFPPHSIWLIPSALSLFSLCCLHKFSENGLVVVFPLSSLQAEGNLKGHSFHQNFLPPPFPALQRPLLPLPIAQLSIGRGGGYCWEQTGRNCGEKNLPQNHFKIFIGGRMDHF